MVRLPLPDADDSSVSVAYQHVREEEPRPPSILDPEITPVADAIGNLALTPASY